MHLIRMRRLPGLVFLCMHFVPISAQQSLPFDKLSLHSPYVDSIYHRLSRKRRISQLFMMAAYSNRNTAFSDSVGRVIEKYQPGSIIFFQGSPVKQAVLENTYQNTLRVKALVAMDGEWGLGMRLDSTLSYPYQMTLGAVRDNTLIQLMGANVATNVDSHLDLPVIPFSRSRLDSLELHPFRRVIAGGTGAVMVAHLNVPAIDTTRGLPSTLSQKVVGGLLIGELNFKGLVITDAMNMLGLQKYCSPPEAAVLALRAGNDVVEMSPDLAGAIKAVRKAIRHKILSKTRN